MSSKKADRSSTERDSNEPSPSRALILWALIAKGGEAAQSALKPSPAREDREHLEALGLVHKSKKGRSYRLEVTEAGWHWASQNTALSLSGRTNGTPVLMDLLARLGDFIEAGGLSLAEIIHPRPAPRDAAPADAPQDLESRIRQAYLDATGGAYARRLRLADLRDRLSDVPHQTLDETLLNMAETARINLIPIDDLADITAADTAAALRVGPFPRHIMWIDA